MKDVDKKLRELAVRHAEISQEIKDCQSERETNLLHCHTSPDESFEKIKSEEKCKILGNMIVMQHINILKPITIMGYSGEFPWESEDESPFTRLEELKAILSE